MRSGRNYMLLSHECPISLLEKSRQFNDYDYALVHLFEEIPEYYDFFVESLKQGRQVILDNSIFELGTAFNSDKFFDWVNKLKPTEYIIPDALEDCLTTMDNALDWKEKYIDEQANTCGHSWRLSLRNKDGKSKAVASGVAASAASDAIMLRILLLRPRARQSQMAESLWRLADA